MTSLPVELQNSTLFLYISVIFHSRSQKHETAAALPVYLEDGAVVEVVGAGSALQRGEGHVSSGERRDVAEVVGAERLLLVLSGADEAVARLLIRLLAGAAVVLVRHPGAALLGPLVDGEALGTAGVELEPHVCDVKGLTCRGKT